MKFLSVCSGIEAASVAWEPLGMKAFAFSEIEAFPSAVLAHHYPTVPNLGDMTKFQEWPDAAIDILVGGTPCQSFSVAGLRKGLADPRGNLMLTYLAIAAKYQPSWLVWENVPGVLSSNKGRDFGTLLAGLGQLGYGFAYRVLDAQYFGVPQRRRRVFVVGHLGDWRAAAAVLFERHSMQGHPAPSRQARQDVAGTIGSRTTGGGGLGTDFELGGGLQVAGALTAHAFSGGAGGRPEGAAAQHFVPHKVVSTLDASFGRLQGCSGQDANHGHSHLIAFGGNNTAGPIDQAAALNANRGCHNPGDFESGTLLAFPAFMSGTQHAATANISPALCSINPTALTGKSGVRRLTPRECERLQGLPDDYTLITYRNKPAADGPRYKALGNSMAEPVMRWIGERIQAVQSIKAQGAAA